MTKASVSERLKEIKTLKEVEDEKKVLDRCLDFIEAEADAAKAANDLRKADAAPRLRMIYGLAWA